MKRYLAFLWLLACALSLAGCTAPAAPSPSIPPSDPPALTPIQPRSAAAPTGTEPVTAALTGGYASIALDLPAGWEYELLDGDEYIPLSLAFWPEGKHGRITLSFYDSFGVCGTGLSSQDVTFAGGRTASAGTYDGHAVWDFLSFHDTPGHYVAMTDGVEGWWAEYGDAAMAILGSAKLGDGLLTRSEAAAIARSAAEGAYGEADGWSRFDHLTGQWSIHLGSPNGTPGSGVTVVVGRAGSVLEIRRDE